MMTFGLARRTSVIALDMGACSLRGIQLVRAGRSWRVHHWLNLEFEPASAQPEPIDYAAHLEQAIGPGSFSGNRAAILLTPPDVEYKLLDVPASVLERPPAEIRHALQFELDRQMPWPASELEMAAWPVESNGNAGGNAMIVGARSSSVQQFVEFLGGELECVRADVAPSAMIRVCTQPGAETDAGAVWGVLDLGFRSSRLYLMHKGRLIYARVLRGGGRELTETLSRELHVDFRMAEQYKRIYGVRQTERGFRSLVNGLSRISEDALPGVLFAIVRPALDTLVSEIERSYRFALGRLPSVPSGPLYLIGGGARMQGLREVFAARLGLTVVLPEARSVLDPADTKAQHPACSPIQFPTIAPCVGLALVEEEA